MAVEEMVVVKADMMAEVVKAEGVRAAEARAVARVVAARVAEGMAEARASWPPHLRPRRAAPAAVPTRCARCH